MKARKNTLIIAGNNISRRSLSGCEHPSSGLDIMPHPEKKINSKRRSDHENLQVNM